ncbi:MAG: hypothetical protein ACRD9R_23495, partial [Pyrinomonadaceae bacterium]
MTKALERAATLVARVRRSAPEVVELARAVSLAARVEPALLRRARLDLLPHLDAGAEADLWFSPLVEAHDALALTFAPAMSDVLRRELAENQTLLERAWAVVSEVH